MSKARKSNHGRSGPRKVHTLEQGQTRHTIIQHKDGDYVTIRLEYKSIARAESAAAQHILQGMAGGAMTADRQVLAVQRKEEIVEGQILTPDCTSVVERWIPETDELIVLRSRRATLEDLRDLERYNEKPGEGEQRRAEAAKLIEQRDELAAEPTAAETVQA